MAIPSVTAADRTDREVLSDRVSDAADHLRGLKASLEALRDFVYERSNGAAYAHVAGVYESAVACAQCLGRAIDDALEADLTDDRGPFARACGGAE